MNFSAEELESRKKMLSESGNVLVQDPEHENEDNGPIRYYVLSGAELATKNELLETLAKLSLLRFYEPKNNKSRAKIVRKAINLVSALGKDGFNPKYLGPRDDEEESDISCVKPGGFQLIHFPSVVFSGDASEEESEEEEAGKKRSSSPTSESSSPKKQKL